MPWRIHASKKRRQYYAIVSEFMLQQTQVKTVIPYFKKFVSNISNLKILSESSERKILKLWEGLGYYRRAKYLHRTSKILINDFDGKIPKKFEEIIKLPGVGEYTGKALLALLYNKPYVPVDGNVKRVFSRLFLINANSERFHKEVRKFTNKFFYTRRNSDLAEALMEFGALICKPQNPKCRICELKKYCKFYKKGGEILQRKKNKIKEKKFNIYCYLNRGRKEIALTKNDNLSFLKNFMIPKVQMAKSNSKIKGWNHLCNYKNNISNIKMNVSLFYKFTNKKPAKFKWYSVTHAKKEIIPSFTKKIINEVQKIYL